MGMKIDILLNQYECTGDVNADGKDIAQLSIYHGNDKCVSQLSTTVERHNKTCGEEDITCNCEGNGEECSSLLWRYENYIGLNKQTEIESECDDQTYSEWLYVVNYCIPNNNGGSTQLKCFENSNDDNIDDYRLIQYDTFNCKSGGIDITNNIRTNCTVVICNSHLLSDGNQGTDVTDLGSDIDDNNNCGSSRNIVNIILLLLCLDNMY